MGKRGGKKDWHSRGQRGGNHNHSGQRVNYAEVVKHNTTFEAYYNALGIFEHHEKEDFWAAFRRELPNSFRFTGSKRHALAVQQRLIDFYIPEIIRIRHEDDVKVEPPTCVQWFPDQLAWSMTTPKNIVRRFPPFASFQKFLVSETSIGNINRQEVVSMIPPLFMHIEPGMTVLDLCAAPGSKAAQLLEMLHTGEEDRVRLVQHSFASETKAFVDPANPLLKSTTGDEPSDSRYLDDGRSTGLLIANDVDYKRSHMLVHQMKRLCSPNLIVTNHDATHFPSIRLPSKPTANETLPSSQYLKFDRILADVPCSGDGTCRKNPNIWKDWNPSNPLGLHITQVRILVRALQMLKVGGRVVYSTCSLNPVENEAVVASAIERCGGLSRVCLIDCTNEIPGLRRKPGLANWAVMDKQSRVWNSWEEVRVMQEQDPSGLSRLVEGMFAPVSPRELIPLGRCMRVLPHQQDTGGFFIAVLEKLSEIKARPESGPASTPKAALHTTTNPELEEEKSNPAPSETIKSDGISNNSVEQEPHKISRIDQQIPLDLSATLIKRNRDDEEESGLSPKRPKGEDYEGLADIAESKTGLQHEDTVPPENVETETIFSPSLQTKGKKHGQYFADVFRYLPADHEELKIIFQFFGLSPRFPRDRFMVRNISGEPVKSIYYTSALVRDILTENEGKGMKFVHSGIKMFVKQDIQKVGCCKWRIQNEGMPLIEAWVSENRVIRMKSRAVFRKLLVEMFPKLAGDSWKDLGDIGERARDIELGCYVLQVEDSEGEDGFGESMVFPIWRSLHSLNLMLPKEDRKALLLRLYNDETPLSNHTMASDGQKKNSDAVALDSEEALATQGDTKDESRAGKLGLGLDTLSKDLPSKPDQEPIN
ncbi:MAG: hypothetical protein M1829_004449 [Trizodia sp. TS-e1964]|nr:MAG: hypothetical protein M1829_004449 [Trizodia sp. TS-e1964]